jgi:hypothetical protein
LAGRQQILENSYGRIVFKEAQVIASSHHQTREDKFVRNVAFSILLGALALLQVAVVAAELSPSRVQTAAVESNEFGARNAFASTGTERKASTL